MRERNTKTTRRRAKAQSPRAGVGGRRGGPKTRNCGEWTEARYNSFIKSLLRSGTMRWGPIQKCLKNATTKRGFKRCNGCGKEVPVTLPNPDGGKRIKNVHVDHIKPIIDPATGFTTWDDCIARMFCELDNLQVLCKECHDIKCAEEKQIAKERKQREKLNEEE